MGDAQLEDMRARSRLAAASGPHARGASELERRRPPDTRGGRDLVAAAVQHVAALAALPNLDPVVCHSDLHTLNLIDCGDSLVLLDWEYAHASDPLWDLAG